MKNAYKLLTMFAITLIATGVFAQKSHLKIEIENINLNMPTEWKANKRDNLMGYDILLSNNKDQSYVSIYTIRKTMNLESAIMDQSAKTSRKTGFEDMIIEKVRSKKLNKKHRGKFLEFTNSPLRDYFRGGYYGIEDRGYTYIIEYYSLDKPKDRDIIESILRSIEILEPELRPNFFQIENQYLPQEIGLGEEEEDLDEFEEEEFAEIDEDAYYEAEIDTESMTKKEVKKLKKKREKEKKKRIKQAKKAEKEKAKLEKADKKKLEDKKDEPKKKTKKPKKEKKPKKSKR